MLIDHIPNYILVDMPDGNVQIHYGCLKEYTVKVKRWKLLPARKVIETRFEMRAVCYNGKPCNFTNREMASIYLVHFKKLL